MQHKLQHTIKLSGVFILFFAAIFSIGCHAQKKQTMQQVSSPAVNETVLPAGTAVATFGNGCFWCTEAVFQQLNGVIKVESGYSGGQVSDPTYKEVCMGTTGHAECLQITYDSTKISFDELLEVFWKTHDPTTLNRQGADEGTQYRSVIFYHDERQKELALQYKTELDKSGAYDAPVVTTLEPYAVFYKAEDYHQNYFNENGQQPYCRLVIQPKLEKFRKVFKDKLKQ